MEASYWLAHTLYVQGRLGDSMEVALAAAKQAERVRVVHVRISTSWIRTFPLLVEISAGDWSGALTRLERESAREEDPHYRIRFRHLIATWIARLGVDGAAAVVGAETSAGRRESDEVDCDRCRTEFTLRAAEALARVGDPGTAAAMVSDWQASHPRLAPTTTFWKLRAEASVAATLGTDDAAALLHDLASRADRFGMRLEAIWARLDLAWVLGGSDPGAARSALESAVEEASRAGAATEEALARRQLRGLGVRAWRRSSKRAGPALSPRETEVARLVAAGSSNPEIAKTLFLSPRTVERHVSNILSKLDVRNRIELARRLATEEDLRDAGPKDG